MFYKALCICNFIFITQVNCRVSCNDLNADQWNPVGYSCPLTCGNIIAAVLKLKMSDHQEIISKNFDFGKRHIDKKVFEYYMKLMTSYNGNKEELLRNSEQSQISSEANINIEDIKDISQNLLNGILRSNIKDGVLLTSLVNLMNNTNKNDSLTEDLINKISNVQGVELLKLILFLRNDKDKQIKRHKKVQLKPRNCLTLTVAGCFCKRDFVENHGQCVDPKDCLQGYADESIDYLNRIQI